MGSFPSCMHWCRNWFLSWVEKLVELSYVKSLWNTPTTRKRNPLWTANSNKSIMHYTLNLGITSISLSKSKTTLPGTRKKNPNYMVIEEYLVCVPPDKILALISISSILTMDWRGKGRHWIGSVRAPAMGRGSFGLGYWCRWECGVGFKVIKTIR